MVAFALVTLRAHQSHPKAPSMKDTKGVGKNKAYHLVQNIFIHLRLLGNQCDQKKWPNVYKKCPKMISLEK